MFTPHSPACPKTSSCSSKGPSLWLALMTTATTTSFPSHGVRELHQRRSPSFGQHCLLDQTPPLVKARLALGTTPQCPAHSPGSGAPDLDPDPPDPDPPDEAHTAFVATLPRVIVLITCKPKCRPPLLPLPRVSPATHPLSFCRF